MPLLNLAPEFSISQQITSLVKFAHIACALFLKHEGAFIFTVNFNVWSGLLYFELAHTKILDAERKVFLCLLGDDILEVLSGRVRMIGAHSPNVNAEEMRNRVGSALRLFEKYPKWVSRP